MTLTHPFSFYLILLLVLVFLRFDNIGTKHVISLVFQLRTCFVNCQTVHSKRNYKSRTEAPLI